MIILGIETSCDETAAAVVADGRQILSSIVASQIEVHHPYGGVVPELASRKHMENIVPVFRRALGKAGVDARQIEGVAVTRGPGLVGALLVGFSFAKAFAMSRRIPWIGVSHLEGHLNSLFLESEPPPFPFVALLVSGGHTNIYHVTDHTAARLLGQTRDDAAGEAFDKVAKMLGLGYPGGRVISQLADRGDPDTVSFTRPYLNKDEFDFSFSGIKAAVSRYLHKHPGSLQTRGPDIAAGFQEAVVEVLSYKILHAAEQMNCGHLALVGGVAANRRLREVVAGEADRRGLQLHIPSAALCGDNAAMIAAAGYHHLSAGRQSSPEEDVYSRQAEPFMNNREST
ncbi:MAG: tRNA threonylcarbamoyladenosine biosynthesis protein TsaB [Deltaproteobacteria bacterium SG8_13]|nr:MAG: tRNA threonylcarbamoyladenosine biosynthesis protein TsaB [Deltaproteobacteria bacterium SG8_13]